MPKKMTVTAVAYIALVASCGARSLESRSLLQVQDGPSADISVLPPLPYATTALEPYIDNATTTIHHVRHFNTFVVNLRQLVATNSQLAGFTLAQLQRQAGTDLLSGTAATSLRNNGGGFWNHAFFFKHLAPATSPQSSYQESATDALKGAIDYKYGNFTNFQAQFAAAATGVFGAGWAWLIATDHGLSITTTPNQNNPLQTAIAASTGTTVGTPVLGIDVWEHAYYLKHQANRPGWIANFWYVLNWVQISQNYQYAAAGGVPDTAAGPMLESLHW